MDEARNFMQMYFKKDPPAVFKLMDGNRMANVRQQIARLERVHFGG